MRRRSAATPVGLGAAWPARYLGLRNLFIHSKKPASSVAERAPTAMTFADWAAYFRANQSHLAELSWDDTYRLTDRERRAAGRSLQHFQRGESSEGHHLYHHAQASHDADYLAAMRLFIAEEQGHAQVLGRFLDAQGLPRLRSCFTDNVFRGLRRLSGWEHTIRLLLTAEIIAAVYYRALYYATYSGLLQQICLRILRDEQQHIAFQCSTLRHLRPRRSALGWWLSQQLHRGLMIGATVVVWLCYNRTLWAGGMGPVGFAASVAREWERAQELLRAPAAALPGAQGGVAHLGTANLSALG